jgi:hypothetical protein
MNIYIQEKDFNMFDNYIHLLIDRYQSLSIRDSKLAINMYMLGSLYAEIRESYLNYREIKISIKGLKLFDYNFRMFVYRYVHELNFSDIKILAYLQILKCIYDKVVDFDVHSFISAENDIELLKGVSYE